MRGGRHIYSIYTHNTNTLLIMGGAYDSMIQLSDWPRRLTMKMLKYTIQNNKQYRENSSESKCMNEMCPCLKNRPKDYSHYRYSETDIANTREALAQLSNI